MLAKVCVFVILAFGFLAYQADAQTCTPKRVVNLTLDIEQVLFWELNEEEECEISQFLVAIFHPNQSVEYAFSTTSNFLNVSFLTVCDEWTFVVSAVSGVNNGPAFRMVRFIPIPPSADLSLTNIRVAPHPETGTAHLRWDLVNIPLRECLLQYRVTVERDGSPVIEDIYALERSINVHFLSPCTGYEFTVRAINTGHPTVEGPIQMAFHYIPPYKQHAPRLVSVDPGTTSFNMTWRLESFPRNPCGVTTFYIEGGDYFNQTVAIEDHRDREPIEIAIENVRANSMYFFHASVYNAGGWSDFAPVAVQTLPEA